MIDLTPILTSLIVLLVASLIVLAVTEIVPRVQNLWRPFREKWPMEAVFLEAQADLAVKAAEQWLTLGEGSEKLDYALNFVENQARKYGYSFDEPAVRTLVEAKVKELHERVAAAASAPQPGKQR